MFDIFLSIRLFIYCTVCTKCIAHAPPYVWQFSALPFACFCTEMQEKKTYAFFCWWVHWNLWINSCQSIVQLIRGLYAKLSVFLSIWDICIALPRSDFIPVVYTKKNTIFDSRSVWWLTNAIKCYSPEISTGQNLQKKICSKKFVGEKNSKIEQVLGKLCNRMKCVDYCVWILFQCCFKDTFALNQNVIR